MRRRRRGRSPARQNRLFFGDNLEVLREYVKDETVDLVYLDPPFKSNQDYNVLFAQHGTRSAAQIKAFEDTWRWDESAARAYEETVQQGNQVAQAMRAFRTLLGTSDLLAYLSMMAPRLIQLHRVLKPTGSIYLHCDPAASHYLKLLMDSVFGPANFMGELVWRRTAAHVTSKRWPRLHDVLLNYARDISLARFHPPRVPPDPAWIEREYRHEDERGRYSLDNLTGAGKTKGPSGQPWRGIDPAEIGAGRHWRYVPTKLEALDAEGRIYWPKRGRYPKLKQYLHESGGKAVGDLWTDISVIGRTASERLGYQTQKPEALLERIVVASSDEGDLVLDPFCGCGTTVAVAQRLNRRWVGIDITYHAIELIQGRLLDSDGEAVAETYDVIGEPVTLDEAESLFRRDKHQFEGWALGLAGARRNKKRGADRGIDGRLLFSERDGTTKEVILSVKGGRTGVSAVRDLRGVVEREEAALGVFITLRTPTQPMRTEAAAAEFFESSNGTFYPRIQILTIEELLNGKPIQYPVTGPGVRRRPEIPEQLVLQPEPRTPRPPARPRTTTELVEELLEAARITAPPVRLEPIMEQLKMELSARRGQREDALLIPMTDPKAGRPRAWMVYYNPQKPETRRRFTLAHEIGHVVLHGDEWLAAAARGGEGVRFKKREREVERFAAELLMPAQFVRDAVAQYGSDIELLRALFRVGREPMGIRLRQLGFMS